MKEIVLAKNIAEYNYYVREQMKLGRSFFDFFYCRDVDRIQGILIVDHNNKRNCKIVRYGNWWENSNYDEWFEVYLRTRFRGNTRPSDEDLGL